MKKLLAAVALAALSGNAWASSTRAISADTITNTSGGSALSVPGTGGNVVSDTATQTLTNKSISGSTNTLTAIPAGTALSGQVGVSNGGTGLSSGTSGGILGFTASGTITSSAALTANALVVGGGAGATPTALGSLGTTTTVLHGNAGGAPTYGAVALTSDVSGTLPVGNGGTGVANPTAGSVLVGNGSSAVSLVAPGTSGNILTSNGTTWTSAAPSNAPSVSGTAASPITITAVGGVSFSGTNYFNVSVIGGSGGNVTVSATPQVAAATSVGQQLILIGTTNTVTLADGNGLSLNGPIVLGANGALTLVWTGTVWAEVSRR